MKRIALFLAAAAAMLLAATPAAASPNPTPIVNAETSHCLTPQNFGSANGTKIIQWNCLSAPGLEQDWTYPLDLAWSPIRNAQNGKCLAISGGSMNAGAPAILWPCNSGYEQLWSVSGERPTTLVNYKSRQCLAIPNGTHTPGTVVIQWPCNGGWEQRWFG